MADVIFAGSKTRAPFKRAEVALTFDNQEHYLNSDLEDIEIKSLEEEQNEYLLELKVKDKIKIKTIEGLIWR